MSRLGSKVAVVIGGVGGIGGAISEKFVAEGAQVYATSRRGAGDESQIQTVNLQTIRADASNRIFSAYSSRSEQSKAASTCSS
jgi:NAD(P)-dependent dehydrogenase (short-subunit alcohol dehydrogenase family)